jgi:hypothetical protein
MIWHAGSCTWLEQPDLTRSAPPGLPQLPAIKLGTLPAFSLLQYSSSSLIIFVPDPSKMLLTNLISLLPLLAGSYAAPLPGITEDLIVRSEISDANTAACPNFCGGTAYNASLQHDYVCGDPRLGPKRLPERIPLGDLVNTYDRFGGLCPGQFLAKWFDASTGYYIYPPDNGFQLNNAGATIQGLITLPVGFLLDRFGSEYGTYTSPQGAPYMQRALPPSNLDTPQSKPT